MVKFEINKKIIITIIVLCFYFVEKRGFKFNAKLRTISAIF